MQAIAIIFIVCHCVCYVVTLANPPPQHPKKLWDNEGVEKLLKTGKHFTHDIDYNLILFFKVSSSIEQLRDFDYYVYNTL